MRATRTWKCQAGFTLLEVTLSLSVFTILFGAVVFALKSAISVSRLSLRTSDLLYRVARAADQVEITLTGAGFSSLQTLGDGTWTLEGLERYFEVVENGSTDADEAEQAGKIQESLNAALQELSQGTPDLLKASSLIQDAESDLGFLIGGALSILEGTQIQSDLNQLRTDIGGGNLSGVTAMVPLDHWTQIENMAQTGIPPSGTLPLRTAYHVLFRQSMPNASGVQYVPGLSDPPQALYFRPMQGSPKFELVYYDGQNFHILLQNLVGGQFDLMPGLVYLTLQVEERVDGVTQVRQYTRSIRVRAP